MNVASILSRFPQDKHRSDHISYGKTNECPRKTAEIYMSNDAVPMIESYYRIKAFHLDILSELFQKKNSPVFAEVKTF